MKRHWLFDAMKVYYNSFSDKALYSFFYPFLVGNSQFNKVFGLPQLWRLCPDSDVKIPMFRRILCRVMACLLYTGLLLRIFFLAFGRRRAVADTGGILIVDSPFYYNTDVYKNSFFGNLLKELDKLGVNYKMFLSGFRVAKHEKYTNVDFNFASFRRTLCYKRHFAKDLLQATRKFCAAYSHKTRDLFDFQARVFKDFLPLIVAYNVVAAENLLFSLKPNVVVGDNEANMAVKSLIYAKKISAPNVKVVALQFGPIPEPQEIGDNNVPYNELKPDYKFVDGINDKDVLVRFYGYDPKTITASGEPRYDDYFDDKKFTRTRSVVFYDGGYRLRQNTEVFLDLISEMNTKEHNNVTYVIKMHPRDSDNLALILAKVKSLNLTNVRILTNEISNNDLLSAANCAIMYWSTVSIEALLAGTNLIFFEQGAKYKNYPMPYVNERLAVFCNNTDDLEKFLVRSLKGEKFMKNQRALRKYYQMVKASPLIARRIASIVRT